MHFLSDLIAIEKAKLWHSLARAIAFAFIGVIVLAAAAGGAFLLLFGAYVSLSSQGMDPWRAGLLVGGLAVLVVALLVVIAVWLIGRQGRVPERLRSMQGMQGLASVGEAATASAGETLHMVKVGLGRMIKGTGITMTDVVLTALVAGMALGVSPRLRDKVLGRNHREFRNPR